MKQKRNITVDGQTYGERELAQLIRRKMITRSIKDKTKYTRKAKTQINMGVIITIVVFMVLVLVLVPFIIAWKVCYDAYRLTYAYNEYSNWDVLWMAFRDMIKYTFNY